MTQMEIAGRALAKSVARLKPTGMRGFVTGLATMRKGVLEDLADVIVSLRRRDLPTREYRLFWSQLTKRRAA